MWSWVIKHKTSIKVINIKIYLLALIHNSVFFVKLRNWISIIGLEEWVDPLDPHTTKQNATVGPILADTNFFEYINQFDLHFPKDYQ